jgi:hypothetical protein
VTRISWWFVNNVSRVLEADERDAVLGDFAESEVTGGEALRDLLGLVVRRQAILWKDWHPWLALVGIVCLVDWRLSLFSLRLGNNLAMQCLTCWRFGTRFEDGLTVSQDIVAYACQCLALIFWSWTAGFVLGSLSRRTIWVSAPIACLIWLLAGGVTRATFLLLLRGLPLIAETALLLLPSIWGVRQGRRHGALEMRQTILLASAVATVTLLATWTGGWWQTALESWSGGAIHSRVLWQTRLASFAVVNWPVSYLVAMAILTHGQEPRQV